VDGNKKKGLVGGRGGFFIIILNWGSIGPKEVGWNTRYSGTSIQEFPPLRTNHFSTQDKKAQKWVLIPYGKAP